MEETRALQGKGYFCEWRDHQIEVEEDQMILSVIGEYSCDMFLSCISRHGVCSLYSHMYIYTQLGLTFEFIPPDLMHCAISISASARPEQPQ
jgi:hypothetical protein